MRVLLYASAVSIFAIAGLSHAFPAEPESYMEYAEIEQGGTPATSPPATPTASAAKPDPAALKALAYLDQLKKGVRALNEIKAQSGDKLATISDDWNSTKLTTQTLSKNAKPGPKPSPVKFGKGVTGNSIAKDLKKLTDAAAKKTDQMNAESTPKKEHTPKQKPVDNTAEKTHELMADTINAINSASTNFSGAVQALNRHTASMAIKEFKDAQAEHEKDFN